MNEEKFDLRFMGKLDLQQIERATQYQRRTRLGGRLISLSLFFIIMYFLIYNALDNVSDYSQLNLFLLSAGTVLVGGGIGVLAGKMAIRNWLKATFQSTLRKGYVGEYAVNHIGIQIKVKDEYEFFEWKSFMSAHEFEDMFLLVVNKYSYMPIPKSFFRTKEEIDTFKKILSHHVRNFRT